MQLRIAEAGTGESNGIQVGKGIWKQPLLIQPAQHYGSPTSENYISQPHNEITMKFDDDFNNSSTKDVDMKDETEAETGSGPNVIYRTATFAPNPPQTEATQGSSQTFLS